jgi:hypothetical protein
VQRSFHTLFGIEPPAGNTIYSWPPRPPDITPFDFFLWGSVKDVYVPLLPNDLQELRQLIITAVATISKEICWESGQKWTIRVTRAMWHRVPTFSICKVTYQNNESFPMKTTLYHMIVGSMVTSL